ncbi:hypothetical protein J437_LFUL015625 [Ladona fulva]|uniref:MYND-type domain-containing protein n=1 Tax=Ladona fulva TaxID=123851 RepID=A0A8K0KHF7_LADFU|nr:hypothetical protein J437_LFUL015625 [Ladona fulva]
MNSPLRCEECGVGGNLLRCSRCKNVYYCSKDHQKLHWKEHKPNCGISRVDKHLSETLPEDSAETESKLKVSEAPKAGSVEWKKKDKTSGSLDWNNSVITFEGSSESEILNARIETLSPDLGFRERGDSLASKNQEDTSDKTAKMPLNETPVSGLVLPNSGTNFIEEICRNVIRDMDEYGVCVVDNFLGPQAGRAVLKEVTGMYSKGVFKDGQLVSNKAKGDLKTIRGDQITWIDGKEKSCRNIGHLISKVDTIIITANRLKNNGKMGDYNINGRTKILGRFPRRVSLLSRLFLLKFERLFSGQGKDTPFPGRVRPVARTELTGYRGLIVFKQLLCSYDE